MPGLSEFGGFDPYVPRRVLRHLGGAAGARHQSVDGTMVFCDLSGFTRLSERLQRRGAEGAELLAETINGCFTSLLAPAYANGGDMIKFGGDALLLFYEGEAHAARACRSAVLMRQTLRVAGRVVAGSARVTLRMTVGVHSGTYRFFLVGDSHTEHLVAGPAVTGIVETEGLAESGQIVVSGPTAALLPGRCLGPAVGPAGVAGPTGPGAPRLLRRSPLEEDFAPDEPAGRPPEDALRRTLSTAVRAHVAGGRGAPEHRTTTVAFLKFSGTDMFDGDGAGDDAEAAAEALGELVADVTRAADDWEVCFLHSDVDAGGGKLILTAGTPKVVGDDEERLLLASRQILDGRRRLPVRIGVNRGPAFAGEVGPPYRRTYTVMGDTVNLAARVMAKAPPGSLWATEGVLERSTTRFETVTLEPFLAKGKSRPVQAWEVGPARRTLPGGDADGRHDLPLVGRAEEMAALGRAIAAVRAGSGALVEIVGEAGIGKSRLVGELRARFSEHLWWRATCEAYTATVPYSLWHGLLRQVLRLGWDAPPGVVVDHLRRAVTIGDGDLAPWLPLLASALDVEMDPTPEVADLSPEFRRDKLHETVLRFLRPALAHPTLVEIEHAHAMDEASSALLGALVEILPGSAWLMVVTRRPEGSQFEAPEAPQVTTLRPGPLSNADATALAEAATDAAPLPPHAIGLAVERAGGSPQFLLDLLSALGDAAGAGAAGALPASAGAAAMARIDALGPTERNLVRRASVLGMTFHRRHLEALWDPDRPPPDTRAWAALDGVCEDRGEGRLRFRRAAVREAAYASLPFRTRRQLHAGAAALLEAEVEAGAGDPAVLSLHHLLAGSFDRALPLARAAAQRASDRAAPADAARLYRRALEAGRAAGAARAELAALWEAQGVALRRAGESTAAARAFSTALRLTPSDPIRRAELCHEQSRLPERTGRVAAAVRFARKGLEALEGVDGPEASKWRADLTLTVASMRLGQGRLEETIRLCWAAMMEAKLAGAERALAQACSMLDWALVNDGRAAEARHSTTALEIYDALGNIEDKAIVLNNLGMFAYWEGRWDDAVALYREAAGLAERAGDVVGVAYGDCNVGEVLSDQGRYGEAAACLGRTLRVWRATGDDEGCAFVRMLLGRLAAREGRSAEGQDLLAAARAEFEGLGMGADATLARAYEAEAAALAGDGESALKLAASLVREEGRIRPLALRIRGLSHALAGERDRAAADLGASLAAASDQSLDYEVALTLDALDALGLPLSDGGRAERDGLFARLGIVRPGSMGGGGCDGDS